MSDTPQTESQPNGADATGAESLFGPVGRWSLAPVATWLLTDGRRITDPRKLLGGLVEQLDAAGARIDRIRITSPTLHPQLAALGISWIRGEEAQLWTGMHGVMQSDAYIGSPIAFVQQHQQTLHQSIAVLAAEGEHPVRQDLRAEGMRDYLAIPMIRSAGRSNILTIATRDAAGFDDDDVARFSALANLLTPLIELLVGRRTTLGLLDTFVGKRIGDAILIVFEIKEPTRTAEVCQAALDAAIDAFDSIAVVNNRRRRSQLPLIEFGLGLRLGTVTHANVGSPDRLAFNVVGPAVNMTARIQGMTKDLQIPLLVSGEFAQQVQVPLRSVGRHALRGIAQAPELFRLPPE